ncbi:NAD-dependent epimerase/dehydratase family protein [Actinokineospora auranticolor]|uniref:Nucleoside-diphosphate-sugar epimerase n=1 Tax=Actinokineospora auranticolor TaxID=155976 RepID=A0A2S6GTJ8_9PSEU|nr:NAD-dependent epimerase/dehydratase family protein [Actinokineospora auranticolor]PPK68507.1 nucleoside-diphosphate-sugar epimerase [Actinokineospora auranticolor]
MEIIGHGFIADHARRYFGDRHPDTTLIAAGVSSVLVTDVSAFEREATLVYETLRRCRAEGRTAVFLSTASPGMYGAPDSPGTESGPVFPLTPYGKHKLALESVCATSGARWLVLRLAHLVGAGQQRHQLMPSLIRQLLSGSITVHSGVARDLLDITDMVRILGFLRDDDVRGEVVNVASGRPVSIEDVVDGLEQRLGTRAERSLVEMPTKRAVVSVAKLRALVPAVDGFGFGPGYLSALLDRHVGALAAPAYQDLARQAPDPWLAASGQAGSDNLRERR